MANDHRAGDDQIQQDLRWFLDTDLATIVDARAAGQGVEQNGVARRGRVVHQGLPHQGVVALLVIVLAGKPPTLMRLGRYFKVLAVLGFDEESKRMCVETLNPGVSFEQVQAENGFELLKGDHMPETEPPSEEELHILREEVDPFRYVIGRAG